MLAKLICGVFLALLTTEAGAMVNVRISDLHNLPYPPNPVRVAGRVTGINPVTITDGKRSITAANCNGQVGHFLILEGNWNGATLTVTREELTPEFIEIPGSYVLIGNTGTGDDATAPSGSKEYELPQHLRYIGYFRISKYEVTRGEFRNFLESGAFDTRYFWSGAGWQWKQDNAVTAPWGWDFTSFDGPNDHYVQSDLHPVVGINFYIAEAYCKWAGLRLPSEQEWEKAARWDNGKPLIYPWGNVRDPEKANTYNDSNPIGGGQGKYRTTPVGAYPNDRSPYGVMDMAGNLSEYTSSGWKSYPGSNYAFDYTNQYGVVRGYSFRSGVNTLYYDIKPRSAFRMGYPLESVDGIAGDWIGFRVARD